MEAAVPANHLYISAGPLDLTPQKTGQKKWYTRGSLTFTRRIKSHLSFAGIIRRLLYSTRFQDKG